MKTSTGMYVGVATVTKKRRYGVPRDEWRRGKTFSFEHRSALGKMGGAKVMEKYGREHMSAIAKKGGESLKAKRGREYFVELGRKGAAKRREKK